MTPTPTPPPGSMTVPPLAGWGEILTVLGVVLAAGVAFLVIAALAAAWTGRSEWRAYLDGRSGSRPTTTSPRGKPDAGGA